MLPSCSGAAWRTHWHWLQQPSSIGHACWAALGWPDWWQYSSWQSFLTSASQLYMKVKVAQWCLTLCDPKDYTVHGVFQARVLEWVAFPFSRGSSQPRDWTQVSCIAGRFFTSWATREALNMLTCFTMWDLSSLTRAGTLAPLHWKHRVLTMGLPP